MSRAHQGKATGTAVTARLRRLTDDPAFAAGTPLRALAERFAVAQQRVLPASGSDNAFSSGAGVAGPVLCAFTLWVLAEARSRGVRRLYFLSRDGEIFLQIARRLVGEDTGGPELRYLYGGRKVWQLARLEAVDEAFLDYAFEADGGLTLAQVLRRCGLHGELSTLAGLREAGLPAEPAPVLGEAERRALRESLRAGWLKARVLAEAAGRRELLRAYLWQEGFFDGTPALLVDVGWTGKSLRCLAQFLEREDAAMPGVLLFGKTHSTRGFSFPVEGWLFDPDAPHDCRHAPLPRDAYPVLIENFCAGLEGPLSGFAREEGRIVPVQGEGGNAAALAWGLRELRAGILAFCEAVEIPPEAREAPPDTRPLAGALLEDFYRNPTRAEAAALGTYPVEVDAAGGTTATWAPPATWQDAFKVLARGYRHRPFYHWEAASRLRTPAPVLRALGLAERLRGWLARPKPAPGGIPAGEQKS